MDYRLETFLTLCRTLNYRQTAEQLDISQPAVTKQMQSLEEEFGIPLFRYDRKSLSRSPESYILEQYAQTEQYNYNELKRRLENPAQDLLRIGVSKTVGEYLILDDLKKYLARFEDNVELIIDNTGTLLTDLEANKYEFLVIEGNFNKSLYDYEIYSEEVFTGICSSQHPFAGQAININDLFGENLIVREEGSGSREIFESQIKAFGHSIEDFKKVIVVNNIQLIKELVKENLGITFAYRNIIQDKQVLTSFNVDVISAPHQIHIVSLKNTNGLNYARKFFGT